HVHVREGRARRVGRYVADEALWIRDPLLEAPARGVAVRAVELAELVPGADRQTVVRDPGLDQIPDGLLVLVEVVDDRVPGLRPRTLVVRIAGERDVVIGRYIRDVIRPGRGDRPG